MKTLTLRAHFDGESLRLDEPCALDRDTPVTVTIRPRSEEEEDRASWGLWAATSLAGAYAEDEPDYSLALIKEPNPDYEGR
jgi:hypothetical protein